MRLNYIDNIDCMVGLKQLPDKSVDLVLTDIPYNVVNRQSNGLRELNKKDADVITFPLNSFLSEVCRIARGSIYIFCSTEQVSEIRAGLIKAGLSTRLIIWEKTNPSPMNGQHIWLSSVECAVYGKNKGALFNGHCRSSVLRYPCGRNKIHPTQKPLPLFEDLIETSTKPGDVVLDPCMGSGTTAVACLKTGRNYIGFELSPEYCRAAEQRILETVDDLLGVGS